MFRMYKLQCQCGSVVPLILVCLMFPGTLSLMTGLTGLAGLNSARQRCER